MGVAPNIALSVNITVIKAPTKKPTRATAVIGRFHNGANQPNVEMKIPRTIVIK